MAWVHLLEDAFSGQDPELVAEARRARRHAERGHRGVALEILWSHLIRARRAKDSPRQAVLFLCMGHVYRDWMWDLAKKYYGESMEVAQRCGHTTVEALACHSMGALLRAWGDLSQARAPLCRCLALAEGMPALEQLALRDLSACLEAQGEVAEAAALRRRAEALLPGLSVAAPADACPTCGVSKSTEARITGCA